MIAIEAVTIAIAIIAIIIIIITIATVGSTIILYLHVGKAN